MGKMGSRGRMGDWRESGSRGHGGSGRGWRRSGLCLWLGWRGGGRRSGLCLWRRSGFGGGRFWRRSRRRRRSCLGRWLVGHRRLALPSCGGRGGLIDFTNDRTDGNIGTRLRKNPQGSRGVGCQIRRGFFCVQTNEHVAFGDRVTVLFQPFGDGAFVDGFSE